MDRQLFEQVTCKDWLTDEELDQIRQEMVGEGIDGLDEEYMNMLRFSYQMEEFDVVKNVYELGATTTIVILEFDEDDIDEPSKEDIELLKSMQRQEGDIGKIARLIELDESLMLDSAIPSMQQEDTIVVGVWT